MVTFSTQRCFSQDKQKQQLSLLVAKSTEHHQDRHCIKDTHADKCMCLKNVLSVPITSPFPLYHKPQNHGGVKPQQQFFKQEATRKDGRLQNVVKKESSPLQRQQDFDQEILISEHIRTQTDSEPRAAILLGVLPSTNV